MKLISIYDGTLFECQMIKNLLENSGIDSFLKDQVIGTRSAVWRPGGGVKVMVSDMDYLDAKSIVEEFQMPRQT